MILGILFEMESSSSDRNFEHDPAKINHCILFSNILYLHAADCRIMSCLFSRQTSDCVINDCF